MLILQKIIASFVELPGLFMVVLFFLALILFKKKEKKIGCFVIILSCVIWFVSTDIGLNMMVKPYEDQYSDVIWAEHDTNHAIIVVFSGGFVRNVPCGETAYDQIGRHSMMRLYRAYEIYRETGVRMVVTGGNIYDKSESSVAEVMKDVLLSWNVPERDIIVEDQAKTTYENAECVLEIIPDDVDTVLLVTSAIHMHRSITTFDKVAAKQKKSYTVIACPGDYLIERSGIGVHSFLPNSGALSTFMAAFHEWIGNLFYLLK